MNCWIKYFNERYQKNLIAGENWIDIENEIQNVIHSIETQRNFEVIANPNESSNLNIKKFSLDIQSFMRENQTKNRIFEDYYKFLNYHWILSTPHNSSEICCAKNPVRRI